MEKEVTVKKLTNTDEFTYGGGKTGYNLFVETDEGDIKLTTFSETVKDDMIASGFLPDPFKVKYSEKTNDKGFTNRTIVAIADDKGNFKEQPKKPAGGFRGGFKDTKSIQRQTALKCAVEYGIANKLDLAITLDLAEDFKRFLEKE